MSHARLWGSILKRGPTQANERFGTVAISFSGGVRFMPDSCSARRRGPRVSARARAAVLGCTPVGLVTRWQLMLARLAFRLIAVVLAALALSGSLTAQSYNLAAQPYGHA
jgi:hypothetical protein